MQNNTLGSKNITRQGKICLGVLPVFIGSMLFIACGGSEKKDDVPADMDAGIVITDSGISENDASIIENTDASISEDDAGIIEDSDASITENDASIIADDAGDIENDAGTGEEEIEFISIPAGAFTLRHETVLYNSGDTVTLEAFALKKTPVTVAEFEKCVAANACTSTSYYTVSHNSYCNYNRGENWKNHPMNCVDWYGAKEYCEWIGGRLPTEEEWEYASTHNGTAHLRTTYPWGNDAPQHCVTAQYWDSSTNKFCQGNAAAPMSNTNDADGTSDVSLHSPAGDSPRGLVDMSGNVWEWTSSLYEKNSSDYTLKGGAWNDYDLILNVGNRRKRDPAYGDFIVGVRCAK